MYISTKGQHGKSRDFGGLRRGGRKILEIIAGGHSSEAVFSRYDKPEAHVYSLTWYQHALVLNKFYMHKILAGNKWK